MIKRTLSVLGFVTAAGMSALYGATRPETVTPAAAVAPTTSAQQGGTIICPLTGEEILPCCCPVNGGEGR